MARSEDYLDSLLESLNDSDNNSALDAPFSDRNDSRSHSESRYLDEFEKEFSEDSFESDFEKEFAADFLDEEDSEFLKEFERDLERAADIDFDDDSSGILSDIEDIIGDGAKPAPEQSTDEDIPVTNEEEDSILDNLTDILEGTGDQEVVEPDGSDDAPEEDDGIISDIDEEPNVSDTSDTPDEDDEGDEGVISDIEDDSPEAADSSEDTPEAEGVEDEAGEDSSGEASEESSEETSDSDAADISGEEIMNIGDLLDSIDEEGNLEEEKSIQPKDAVDETGAGDSEPAVLEGEEGEEEKVGFLQKILGKLFKKKDKSDEEIEEEIPVEAPDAIDEDPGMDKAAIKAAKKEEKARKKKEKEEAKKQAKAAKEEAKKNKPPKEKKPKKEKKPDNSPKIPIKVILVFLILSGSLVALWFVAEKSISYEMAISSAKSSFDKGGYLDAYRKLGGVELDEEDAILYNRAQLMANLELRMNTYEVYAGAKEINAIDALVRGVVFYKDHKGESSKMGIASEFETLGRKLEEILSETYGVSEDEANDLVEIRDRKEYTRELFLILERQGLWSLE